MNTFYIGRICISSWWSRWSSKFCGLLVLQRRGDRVVGSGGFNPGNRGYVLLRNFGCLTTD
jgi:hypothetical protein